MARRQTFARLVATGRRLAVICGVALALAPAMSVMPAAAATSGPGSSIGIAAADTTPRCERQAGQSVATYIDDDDNSNDDNDDNECPPPVVPEAPMAVLLPLSAGAVLTLGYLAIRRRSDLNPGA